MSRANHLLLPTPWNARRRACACPSGVAEHGRSAYMKPYSAALLPLIGALSIGCHTKPAQSQKVEIPRAHVVPPIAHADPFTRTNLVIKVPTRLTLHRGPDFITITDDQSATQNVGVSVGRHMVTGFQFRIFVYPDGSPRPTDGQQYGLQAGNDISLHGTSTLSRSLGDIPKEGVRYTVDLAVEFFETDIPPQHFWSPKTGRYSSLWEGTITGHID